MAMLAAVSMILQTTVTFVALLFVAVKLGMNKANVTEDTDRVCNHLYKQKNQGDFLVTTDCQSK